MTARAASSSGQFGAAATAKVRTAEAAREITSMRRRSTRSATTPAISTAPARTPVEAETARLASAGVRAKAVVNSGRSGWTQ